MQMIQLCQLDELAPCPYLPGRQKRFEFFLARQVDPAELSQLLAAGWRKFGPYYFRPACPGCRECIPLRIPVRDFAPSRSQRRLLRRNTSLRVAFSPLRYSDRIFAIYRDHARARFEQDADIEEFLFNFFLPSCPALQSEFYLDETLAGVGFLDRSADALSSVYFCFDPAHSRLGLGTYSVLREIAHARSLGLTYYYLGYFVPGCRPMDYKDHFHPREHFDWQTGCWRLAAETSGKEAAV